MSDRVYSLVKGYGDNKVVLRWGVSRFGDKEDPEMNATVSAGQKLGEEQAYIEWLPYPVKQRSAETMQKHRQRNLRRRCEKFPLFADQFEQEGMKTEYFSLVQCQKDYDQRTKDDERWMNKWWTAHPDALRVRLPNKALPEKDPI